MLPAAINSKKKTGCNSKSQTPCLGNLPGFGWAFKSISDADDKQNLMVFLTPHVVQSWEEGEQLYEEKQQFMRGEVEKALEQDQPEKLRQKAYE